MIFFLLQSTTGRNQGSKTQDDPPPLLSSVANAPTPTLRETNRHLSNNELLIDTGNIMRLLSPQMLVFQDFISSELGGGVRKSLFKFLNESL